MGLRKTDSLSWHWALDSCKKLFYVPDANNSLWIPGSPDQDEFSTKTVAALRVCEFSPCRGGLMDISRTEELPFICQFNLGKFNLY